MANELPTINELEQGRAKFAYDCAVKAGSQNKEYKSLVKKVPMLIKTNGLGNTYAFLLSKKKEKENDKNGVKVKTPHEMVYQQTSDWLKKDPKGLISDRLKAEGNNDLVQILIDLEDPAIYRAVTVEVLAFFNWLRRFAEGLIEGEAD